VCQAGGSSEEQVAQLEADRELFLWQANANIECMHNLGEYLTEGITSMSSVSQVAKNGDEVGYCFHMADPRIVDEAL
jgi:hypothetical protein